MNKDFLYVEIRYSQILRSLSQELLQRIHNGQIMAENLEETTDLNDVEIFNCYSNSYLRYSSLKRPSIGIYESVLMHSVN